MVKTTLTILQDKTEMLLEQLEKDYTQMIEDITQKSTHESEGIIEEKQQQALLQAQKEIEKARKKRDQLYAQKKLALNYKGKQLYSDAVEDLLTKAITLVKEELETMPDDKKQHLIEDMIRSVASTIEEQGYNVKDFTFSAWKGYKGTGVKKTLSTLTVKAKNDYLLFEDGIEQRVKEREVLIKEHLLKQLQAL